MRRGKRNILIITPYPLLPPDSGGRLYALRTVECLAGEYNFHLFAFATRSERQELEQDRDALLKQYSEIFQSVTFEDRPVIPHEMNGRLKILRHLIVHTFFGLPLMDVSYYHPEAVKTVMALIKRYQIDLIEMHHLHTAFFRRFIPRVPAVLLNHNIESELWPFWPMQDVPPLVGHIWNFFGSISRKNAHRIEIGNSYRFDARCYISSMDMAKAKNDSRPQYLLPMSMPTDNSVKGFNTDKFILLWVGGFSWPPNAEAAFWFMSEIWPDIRKKGQSPLEVHFVGANPPGELASLHDGREIFIHGYVPDIREFWKKADVFIVPLKAGGGIRIKIVEALNAGVPVVSTSKGCEGLQIEHGKQLFIADKSGDFAEAVLQLLDSPDLRRALSVRGREYCSEYHSAEKTAEVKVEMYNKIFITTDAEGELA